VSGASSQTIDISSRREKMRSGRRSSAASNRYSSRVSGSGPVGPRMRWAPSSSRSGSTGAAPGAALPALRRRMARTRAQTSRGENGLAT
jgi:hypothetical protein